ncbi:Dual specificity protein phosphatase 22-A [Takifugu flavidus]|uniref:Dual specificity protein phosphatase 22-A n=1 Tax=Takifugu flavidus TaxID=433684 RepID=A0A5C6NM75_9TELE|nr:Dual specificity protein phosphatase 22-A [Takifugu flavidus]
MSVNAASQVVDGLYLGNIRDAENKESLSKNGITHILSVYNNAKPMFEGMKYLCIHAADASSQNLWDGPPSDGYFQQDETRCHKAPLCSSGPHTQQISAHWSSLWLQRKEEEEEEDDDEANRLPTVLANSRGALVAASAGPAPILAGVSRSTTMVVAYLMTVTHYRWDECLSAVKAVRSFVGPNYGFQQQLQEYQTTQLSEYRAWLHSTFRPSPFNDEEQVGALLSQYLEQQESHGRRAEQRRISPGVQSSSRDDPESSI